MNKQDNEGFLSRWSRRKKNTTKEQALEQGLAPNGERSVKLPQDTGGRQASSEQSHKQQDDNQVTSQQANIENPATTSNIKEIIELTDTDIPGLETLTSESDYSGFMSPKVSEQLRKMALRKLFQGSEFNLRDGLDDYDDDYTSFVPLGDTVTSDMKHMMQVEARRQFEKSQTSRDQIMTAMTPRQTALASIENHSAPPSNQVEYQSGGNVLIIGDESALRLATELPEPLMARVVLTKNHEIAEGKSSIVIQQNAREMALEGWLGDFKLRLSDHTGQTQTLVADIIVDLTETPLVQAEIPPPGYFTTTTTSLVNIIEEITPLEGTFAKPKFFAYNNDICAHGSSGLSGCTNCIDACPTEAIISIGETISVQPQLCQGGGSCATVCPTGAITYNYPAPGFLVDQIRRMLKAYREADGENPILLLHANDTKVVTDVLADNILPFPLEELASAGAELWAVALSFGASQVLLMDDENTPVLSRKHLRHQLSILNTQLAGLAYPDDAVRLIPPLTNSTDLSNLATDYTEVFAATNSQSMPYFPPATQSGMNDKRQQWLLAMDHFYKYSPEPQDLIPLPSGAPFGTLKVDKDACTLCMACATVCPAKALSGGTDSPVLKFHAANCVQCGLCDTACPEDAIQLQPLFISNREKRNRTQQLNEEKPFHCIDCGKPFASQSMILNMLTKLQGHYMFQDERAKDRLKKCEDCRVVDIVQDDVAMGQPGRGNPLDETSSQH